jgi:hypothetical protein
MRTGSFNSLAKNLDRLKHRDRAVKPPFPCPSSRQAESKIVLDDIEFNSATPDTSYTAVNEGTFIKRLDFSINFRQCPPPGLTSWGLVFLKNCESTILV